MKTLQVSSPQAWRAWLRKHHAHTKEIWFIYYKKSSGKPTLSHDEALDEALCFGWIDSLVKHIDEERYAQKFTPRKPQSKWSKRNRKRALKLIRDGRMAAPGLATITFRSGGTLPGQRVPIGKSLDLPAFVSRGLKANKRAWTYFESLAPSYKRLYIRWIIAAKREETQMRRLQEAVDLLARGQKLGLK
jgi:uncharacterized protein YdeI (YjbR/CyaY-like superfamily)